LFERASCFDDNGNDNDSKHTTNTLTNTTSKIPDQNKSLGDPLAVPAAVAIGLVGMREGGRRRILVPPRLGWAGDGGDAIGPPRPDFTAARRFAAHRREPLLFEAELLRVRVPCGVCVFYRLMPKNYPNPPHKQKGAPGSSKRRRERPFTGRGGARARGAFAGPWGALPAAAAALAVRRQTWISNSNEYFTTKRLILTNKNVG
jgi:hypothetical protein